MSVLALALAIVAGAPALPPGHYRLDVEVVVVASVPVLGEQRTRTLTTSVLELDDQNVALRLVALTDRLYDAGVPLVASGAKLDSIFPAEMLEGGYRKKYLRATSRLLALARAGAV